MWDTIKLIGLAIVIYLFAVLNSGRIETEYTCKGDVAPETEATELQFTPKDARLILTEPKSWSFWPRSPYATVELSGNPPYEYATLTKHGNEWGIRSEDVGMYMTFHVNENGKLGGKVDAATNYIGHCKLSGKKN